LNTDARNADAGLKQLTTGRNADAGLTFFRHFGIRHLHITADVSWFSSSLDCSARSTSMGCLAEKRISVESPSLLYSKPVDYTELPYTLLSSTASLF
jgi:hypothetical protein